MLRPLLLLLLSAGLAGAQTRVDLRRVPSHRYYRDYRFVRPADSSFAQLLESSWWDGKKTIRNKYFNLHPGAPDGAYEVYVDGKLRLAASLAGGVYDGLTVQYLEDGSHGEDYHYRGRRDSLSSWFDSTGRKVYTSNPRGGLTPFTLYYRPDGRPLAVHYDFVTALSFTDSFAADGGIRQFEDAFADTSPYPLIKKSIVRETGGRSLKQVYADGWQSLTDESGVRLQIWFRNQTVLRWEWYWRDPSGAWQQSAVWGSPVPED